MAAFDRFAIVPLNSGLQNNVKPFLIADDAYALLNNAYLWRQRLRKRFGSRLLNTTVPTAQQPLLSQLRLRVETLMGGEASNFVPGDIGQIGQTFSIGNQVFTVWQAAGEMLNTGAGDGLFFTTTGAFTFTGIPLPDGTPVFWYPNLPVMALPQYYDPANLSNFKVTYGFDTQFAYFYSNGWNQLGTAMWTGPDWKLFWYWNYRGTTAAQDLLFVTNNNAADQIKYWNGATGSWTTISPIFNIAGNTIATTRIIIGFQGRLLFLRPSLTIGATTREYTNQVRWSVLGDPTTTIAFRDDLKGQGGVLNAPTKEEIRTAGLFRNRLIVFFQVSTWELVYTANQVQPFKWQQLNPELGADGIFSHIALDEFLIGAGNQGFQTCNGVNVKRIDNLIPDEVTKINNLNHGLERIYAIRDYHFELIYWTYPNFQNNPTFPNTVLVYNYKSNTWAFNDDSITCFGYWQDQPSDIWSTDYETWEDDDSLWSAGQNQSNATDVLAGNQQGFTFICDGNLNTNAPVLNITNIIATTPTLGTFTVINHNLQTGDFVQILNAQGITTFNNIIYVVNVVDANTFTVTTDNPTVITGTYTGGGTISLISQIDILTKQYNFYMAEAKNAYVAKVDFNVDTTVAGAITVDTFVSSSDVGLLGQGSATGSLVGTGVLETFPYNFDPLQLTTLETTQDRVWHPMFLQAEGECVQLRMYFSPTQMRNLDIVTSDFQLNAMIFWATRTSSGFTHG